jgi:hypothetical protein
MALLPTLLVGCGNGGGEFLGGLDRVSNLRFPTPTPTPRGTSTPTPTPTPTPTSTPTPSPTPTPTPSTHNSATGTITFGTGVSSANVTLYHDIAIGTAPVQIGTQGVSTGGTFSFGNLTDGSYTLVVSGSGLRTQSDNFAITGGHAFSGNYTVTALNQAPSKQELQGFSTDLAHLARSIYGYRSAIPIVNAVFSANIKVTPHPRTSPSAGFTTSSVPLSLPSYETIDPLGHLWTNFGAGGNKIAVISNSGTPVGTFPLGSGNLGPAFGIAADSAGDILDSASSTLVIYPDGQPNGIVVANPGLGIGAVAAQNVNLTSPVQITGPHFVGGDGDHVFAIEPNGNTVQLATTLSGSVGLEGAGIAVSPVDGTIWLVGEEETSPGSGIFELHVQHRSADAGSVLEDVDLGVNNTTGATFSGLNDIAIDGSGNAFVAINSTTIAVAKISSGGTLATTVSSGSFPGSSLGSNSISVDPSGNVWVAPANGGQVTRFDNNLANQQSVSVGGAPFEVVTDQNGNAWVTTDTAVVRIAAGLVVPPPNGNFTVTLPDGSQIRVTVANGNTTVQQIFPNGPSSTYTLAGNTVGNSTTSATAGINSLFGPTTGNLTITENATTGVITFNTVTTNAYDGVQYDTTITLNPDGSETVTGQTSNGLQFSGNYTAPSGNGTVGMSGSYTNSITGDNQSVTGTFSADGSLDYSVTDSNGGYTGNGTFTGSGASAGSWTGNVTSTGDSTVLVSSTDSLLMDTVVSFNGNLSTNPIDDFTTTTVQTTGSNNWTDTSVNGTFADNSTYMDASGDFNETDPATDGTFITGQGDGGTDDSGSGSGTYVGFDGSGGSGGAIRGIR